MNSIKCACSLNNQGVALLVSGESSKAMKVFQSALSLLRAAKSITTSCTEMIISCDDASLPSCKSTSTVVSGLQGLQCYVYDHGIMISDNVNSDTDETICLYSAIVHFNSALVSHSEGTALGREKSLMKASMLYSLVVQLLTTYTMPEDTSTSILTLLALNNKAQIHYQQCEYVQSVDCMVKLSEVMGSVPGLDSALGQEDTEEILLNVMQLSTPPMAAQAA
jgi:hypothetical protein